MFKFLTAVSYYLYFINFVSGTNLDSSNRFTSIHLNKRTMQSFDLFQADYGPYKNNYIYSISATVQNRLFTYKKINLNAFAGITGQLMQVGNIQTVQASRNINERVNCNSFMLGFNSGIALEKNILKFKNSRLSFSLGMWSNGIFYNTIKSKTMVFERNDFWGRDSIVLNFKRNSFFYLSPFYQLTLKTKIKSKVLISGIKVIYPPLNGGETNIEYNFF